MSARRAVRAILALVAVTAVALATGITPASAREPGIPGYPEYWFPQWNVQKIWASGDRGQGVTVAVIDTGVQASATDLVGSVLPGTDLTGLGGDGHTDRDRDKFDHGTAMASLIAGHGGHFLAGVAPSSKILPVAVPLVGTNQGDHSPNYLPDAIRYAASHGAKVISMSLGGLRYRARDSVACPPDTQKAILYALARGSIIVAAGGNSAGKGSPTEEPGVCLGVVSVAAVDAGRRPAPFSSRHPYLTVSAPGVSIPTINAKNVIYVGDGTSQATALTSGALALIWAAHPRESNRQITARLMAGLHDAGRRGPDSSFGYGTIDPSASIAAHPGPHALNPVFDRVAPFRTPRGPATSAALTRPRPAKVTAPAAYRRDPPPGTGLGRATWVDAGVATAGLLVLLILLGRAGLRRSRRPRGSDGPGSSAAPMWTGPPPEFAPPPQR